jgi:hypothetical protein
VTNSIYRISVPVEDYQEIEITGSPISVAPDRDRFSDRFDLWFEHYGRSTSCAIWIFGTGHPVPWTESNRLAWTFLGTVVTPATLVWHVYTGPRKRVS